MAIGPLVLALLACGGGGNGGGKTPGPDAQAAPSGHALSGNVRGAAAADVAISLSGPVTASTTTDAKGAYSFSGLSNGTYAVTPSKGGLTFTPASLLVVINGRDIVLQDFTAASRSGGATDGGTVDGGTVDGGTVDGGTVDGGTVDGGTVDGGTEDGGPKDGGSPDGGTSDGGSGSACNVPAEPGSPVSYTSAVQDLDTSCRSGVSDGQGSLALQMSSSSSVRVDFVTSEGAFAGSNQGARLDLIGQANGFNAVDNYGVGSQYDVAYFDPTGSRSALDLQTGSAWQANDPTGGLVVLSDTASTLTAYRTSLEVRWQQPLPLQSGEVLALGVDRAGNVLVVFNGERLFGQGSVGGIWTTHEGVLSQPFVLATGVSAPAMEDYSLWPRIGSGFFVREQECHSDGCDEIKWAFSIDALAQAWTAAPEWLVARPNTLLHMVHGGRAYGVLPEAGQRSAPDCEQTIEVVSPDGTSCGAATFVAARGVACTTAPIEMGYDGSVIQSMPYDLEGCDALGHCSCTWRWWPGFFK